MNHTLAITFSFSILPAGTLALFRFHKAEECFFPFFYFVWIGCANEMLSFALEQFGRQTIVNNNIYMLTEALLLIWFFKRLGVVQLPVRFFSLLAVFLALCWA